MIAAGCRPVPTLGSLRFCWSFQERKLAQEVRGWPLACADYLRPADGGDFDCSDGGVDPIFKKCAFSEYGE